MTNDEDICCVYLSNKMKPKKITIDINRLRATNNLNQLPAIFWAQFFEAINFSLAPIYVKTLFLDIEFNDKDRRREVQPTNK